VEDLAMNPTFWQGKNVFLTGHTGFKGGWLSLWLKLLGANVTGYSLNPSTNPNLFDCAQVADGMTSIIGDIRDSVALAKAIRKATPEIVIHLAAQPLVRRSYVDPVETYSTNVMGTVHLLEAVRQCSTVRAVVNVTTDKCYENKEWIWAYRENEPMGGYDPYSNSKGCSELVTSAYRNSFFNPEKYSQHGVAIATARAGNVIGGGDWAANRLIPDALAAFAQGNPVVIRSPRAVRPWQFVLEPLRGYLTLAERLYQDGAAFSDAFNFGPNANDAKSVEWVVSKLATFWGESASWKIDLEGHSHEAMLLRLDISKAAFHLDWHPQLNIDEALQLTVDWVRGLKQGIDPQALSCSQISDYQMGRFN
jgi:CDP-glucose 4,6-dehydratase